MSELVKVIDFSPLFISLKTGIVSTFIAFFMGIIAARFVMRCGKYKKLILDGVFTLPLVLPPTVAGFLLLLLFSLKRPFGQILNVNFNIKFVQTWQGCVVAACVIAFPLMYRNARSAFEQIDITMIYAARTLGMSEWNIFWKIVIPIAAPGIASGTILAFARALGEYGATSMLAGNILGKTQTIAVAIASESAAGNYDKAGFWVFVIISVAFTIVIALNWMASKYSKNNRGWK